MNCSSDDHPRKISYFNGTSDDRQKLCKQKFTQVRTCKHAVGIKVTFHDKIKKFSYMVYLKCLKPHPNLLIQKYNNLLINQSLIFAIWSRLVASKKWFPHHELE